ncbi:MAG: ferredoxin-type protein NapF [Azoarcus sp.]|nr:ferredoxin-type protein NapF [Azoarcus sp.]
MDIDRRAFLRGRRPRRLIAPPRPPWALNEPVFQQACNRCGDCIVACPSGLLTQGGGGFPEADFSRSHCTFCADCAQACANASRRISPKRQPALSFSPDRPPWLLQAKIGAACLPRRGVLCRSCDEHCEAGAIRFPPRVGGPAQPVIEASFCTGCGECVASCPAQAISMQPGVPQPLSPALEEHPS